ncbi:hypothetical protein Ocin01_15706 [Orchesella cincta]|uniref:Uncharacterized protein n=1 Tax=Orchesella cincta TaxID=48709 RepID=A0A1D2MD86_ORCCI|nr:hypothetical protein Ocin01_15706 [Orchesella cincta]
MDPASAGWAIVSAGSWVCSSLGTLGATATGIVIGVPVAATAASAAMAYKYGVTPALVVSGTSAVVSTGASVIVQGGKLTLRGFRYLISSEEDDND